MRIPVLAACLLFCAKLAACPSASEPDQRPPIASAISRSGLWAVLSRDPYELRVCSSSAPLRPLALNQLNAVTDVSPNPRLEWSADGKYLALIYASGEVESTVEVFEPLSLKRVAIETVGAARWLQSKHLLVYRPAPSGLGEFDSFGIVVLDPASGRRRRFATDLALDGAIETSERHVLAMQILRKGQQYQVRSVRIEVAK